MIKKATLSACGRYRYHLERRWATHVLPIVMLNPSTADAEIDDPTIRRCMGFAKRDGYGGIAVCNLYALRSPSPDDLWRADDPYGPDNGEALRRLALYASVNTLPILCAWG